MDKLEAAAANLIGAIDKRWKDESERKRLNAISPWMEEAIDELRTILAAREISVPQRCAEQHTIFVD